MADDDKNEDEDIRESEDGEEGGEGEDGEGGESDGGKKKLILIIAAAVVLLLIGGGAGLYFTGMLDGLLGKNTEEHGEEGGADDHGAADDGHGKKDDGHGGGGGHGGGESAFLAVPLSPVNINDTGGQTRYLRLSVQLELANPADKASVEAVMPRVVDQFQTYLRELSVRDLRGSAGIYRLQMELLARVNAAAYPIEVKDVLFQEILIQ